MASATHSFSIDTTSGRREPPDGIEGRTTFAHFQTTQRGRVGEYR